MSSRSVNFLASSLQPYLKKGRGPAAGMMAWLDAMESELGSPGAFQAAFPACSSTAASSSTTGPGWIGHAWPEARPDAPSTTATP